MYQVDEKPEILHLYVVREEAVRPSILPVVLSLFTLALLIVLGTTTSSQQPEQRTAIRVPAILSPLKTYTTSIPVMPTGIQTYPATTAHGTLTITSGSILSQELPRGMIFMGKGGSEVVSDAAVFVPAGSAAGYGVAQVSAHAAGSGKNGNIPSLAIDTVEGTSLYIRNLAAFSGGQDAYAIRVTTSQDRQNALFQARATLRQHTVSSLLLSPCREIVTGKQTISVTWTCQFVRYDLPHLPGMKLLHAEVTGKWILLEVVFVVQPRRLETK